MAPRVPSAASVYISRRARTIFPASVIRRLLAGYRVDSARLDQPLMRRVQIVEDLGDRRAMLRHDVVVAPITIEDRVHHAGNAKVILMCLANEWPCFAGESLPADDRWEWTSDLFGDVGNKRKDA
jgi:hypothetical protein